MAKIHIRQAKLDDTLAISALFCTQIPVWQRINAQGQVEDLPYESLSIYERWLHGGAWMSVETGALYLSHLLSGGGLPLVAEINGTVRGYAEVFEGDEPPPFGKHLHLAALLTHLNQPEKTLENALVRYLLEQAQQMDVRRVTVSFSGYDQAQAAFFGRFGMTQLETVGRFAVKAQTGQGFYKVTDHFNADPAQIDGWHMPIGRTESARQHWETLWTRLYRAVPAIEARRSYRLRFTASGRDAYLFCQEDLYNPRAVDLYFWSPKPLTSQIMVAIRDWAHRQSYRTLHLTMPQSVVETLSLDAEAIPFQQVIYGVDV